MDRRRFLCLAGTQFAGVAATQIPSRLAFPAGNSKKVILVGFGGGTRYTATS